MPVQRKKRNSSRNGHLEEAVAILVSNQVQFLGVAARIENDLADIKRLLHHHEEILLRHKQILTGLTEAIRDLEPADIQSCLQFAARQLDHPVVAP